MTYTLANAISGVSLALNSSGATINKLNRKKDAQLFQQPAPGYDSALAYLFDFFGATGTITIDGSFEGDSTAITAFITALESFVNGSQTQSTLHLDVINTSSAGTLNVYINSLEWDYLEGAPGHLTYSITLTEGQGVAGA